MGFLKIALAGVLVLALAFAALTAFGAWRWNGRTLALMDRLEAGRVAPNSALFDAREIEGLPPVVQCYFRTTIPDGAPIVAAATVEHSGNFNMGEKADNWQLFTSRQRVVTRRSGFVWDGHMVMLPGLGVRVHDAYVAGEGLLRPAVLGLFTLMELRGTKEVAEGELMRFFAEAAWYPTALLPSQGVRWEAVDERSARGNDDRRRAVAHADFHLRPARTDRIGARRCARADRGRQGRDAALGRPLVRPSASRWHVGAHVG